MHELPDFPDIRVDATAHGRVVTLASPAGHAVVHEHGAHVTSWTPADGRGDALFLSRRARIDGRSAIRGGVPVIFPQFGPGPLPKHGFARTARWSLEDHGVDGDGVPWARLALLDDERTRAVWPHAFFMQLTVRAGRALAMTLRVTNTGDAAFRFTGALHTYLRVGDVARTTIEGLAGRRVRDQLAGDEHVEPAARMAIAGAVDRVYLDVPEPLRVHDGASGRTCRVSASGFPDVVVWNPWVEGARALDDLDDDEWHEMVCVEAAAVARPVEVRPRETWAGAQEIALER